MPAQEPAPIKQESSNISDVTVILNIHKRDYLNEQIQSILNQTLPPREIWLIQMGGFLAVEHILEKYPFIKHIRSGVDIKYFGRFALARFVKTEYTLVIDDDIIPSRSWLEICLKKSEQYNTIVCSSGRIIPKNDFTPEVPKSKLHFQKYFVGDGGYSPFNNCDTDTFVDYPCCSYFFKTSWLDHFWSVKPTTYEIGEDIHLAASCMLRAQIPTLVPVQNSLLNSGNLKPQYGFDEHASWKKNGFVDKRKEVLEFLINGQKWKPLLWR